ncbi:dephospho-CoA kinase [Deinococcus radiophilus]|uniref:Dephospho-CoA kinase n=1 Tax=Deinococcus radiophilus TaxID=32062 RepID=A0A431VZB7_9DEIO|nr:dephospho-CoA kinase [Deinococcus radiophilus]RTR28621.1 dephospho-CoA kinase [Deinococcus radiophilus]UFA51043.1 dephospho-CoA kinase [Deinococcus radiophilus]
MSGGAAQRTRRLGLTGSIGAGKSTVAALLREAGLTVTDADALGREVTASPEVLTELARLWPEVVSTGPGRLPALDRAALAARVFGHPEQLAQLEALTHPRIRSATEAAWQAAQDRGESWVVHDIPLLFEKGLDRDMDAVWVVDAPLELRLKRLAERSGLTREQALAREAAQWPPADKRARADTVIVNDRTLADLRQQVTSALHQLGLG